MKMYLGAFNPEKTATEMSEDFESFLPSVKQKIGPTFEMQQDNARKAEFVRVLDIFVLGPAMIYSGTGRELPKALKMLMVLTGIGTILYNTANYSKNLTTQKKFSNIR